MKYLNWDLEVLSRAVSYQNLSGAASHIGISQPQLSRIVAKIEADTGLTLLNREVKRHAVWTASAHKVAQHYQEARRQFLAGLQTLREGSVQTTLRVGILEGLSDIAMDICKNLYDSTQLKMIELDVHDLSDLEERYFGGKLDLIFTFREPGLKKPKYQKTLGYQTINIHGSKTGVEVRSLFEHSSSEGRKRGAGERQKDQTTRVFTSNSLSIRAKWIQSYGGYGALPSTIHTSKKNTENETPVMLIGSESVAKDLWGQIVKSIK